MTGRQRLGEERVGDDLVALQRVAALADLDVVRDRADEARQRGEREVVRHLILERAHELLLAREAVEVGVGVAEAHEVERLLARQPLIARLQVDVGVVVVVRAGVLVVVAPVDVHPDTVQLVDHLLEAVEVDGDQVVDRQRGEVLDRQHGALRPAARVGRVDAVGGDHVADGVRLGRAAVDRHVEVAREGEERDGLRLRVGADEHQGVRQRRPVRLDAGAMVVADHERDRGVVSDRDVQAPRRPNDVRCVRTNARDGLVEVEVGAAGDREHERRDREQRPDQDPAEQPEAGSSRGRRLAIAGDRADRPGWKDRMAVAVCAGCSADASLQCRPHENVCGALEGACRVRIAESPEGLAEARAEPALRLGNRDSPAGGVVLDLVAADPPDGEDTATAGDGSRRR